MTNDSMGKPAIKLGKNVVMIRLQRFCSVAVLFIGMAVMIGWIDGWAQVFPSFGAMSFNAAFGFFLLSLSLLGLSFGQKVYPVFTGAFVFVLGLIALGQNIFAISWEWETLLVHAYSANGSESSVRMAPNTALCFVFGGLFFALRMLAPSKIKSVLSFASVISIFVLSLIALLGGLLGITPGGDRELFVKMDLFTSGAFMLLSSGMISFLFSRNSLSNRWSLQFGVIYLLPFGVFLGYFLLWSAFRSETIRELRLQTEKEAALFQSLLDVELKGEKRAFRRLFERMNLASYVGDGHLRRDINNYFLHYVGEKVYFYQVDDDVTFHYRREENGSRRKQDPLVEDYLKASVAEKEGVVGVSSLYRDSGGAYGFVLSFATPSSSMAVWIDLEDWIRATLEERNHYFYLRFYRSEDPSDFIFEIDHVGGFENEDAYLVRNNYQNDNLNFVIEGGVYKEWNPLYHSFVSNLILIAGIVISGLVLYLSLVIKRYRNAIEKETALNEMVRIQSSALYNTPIGISIVDARKKDAPIVYINPAYSKITGYSEAEVLGKNSRFLQGKGTDSLVKARIRKKIENHETVIEEILNYRKDGTPYWNLISIHPIFNQNHELTHYVGSLHDITARKLSEEQFKGAFEHAGIGMALVSVEGKCFKVNSALGKMLGYPCQDLLELNLMDITHPDDLEVSKKLLSDAVTSKREFYQLDKRYFHRDGSVVWVSLSVSSVLNPDESIAHFVSQFQDITERKQQESALLRQHQLLEESNQRYQLATRTVLMGVWDYSLENNELLWDSGMKKLYGFLPDENGITYEGWKQLIHPDDVERVVLDLQRALSGEKPFDTNFRIVVKDGSIRHVHGNADVYRNKRGEAIRMVGLNWDVTEAAKREAELKEAKESADNANRAKSVFLANMSHEIRTPMNAILGFTDILSKQVEDPTQLRNIKAIHTSGKTLLTLINDILDLSKIEAGKLDYHVSPTNLRRILEDMQLIFDHKCAEKNIGFRLRIDESLPTSLLVDEIRLRQVLINIIGNAVKFTKEGEVRIIVESVRVDEMSSRVCLDILVEDTGVGMPAEVRDRIFDAFYQDEGQLKQSGTGLGLAISKRLIDGMNGAISVESARGRGSVFTIKLKDIAIASTIDVLAEQDKSDETIVFDKATILIADDIATNRQLLIQYLQFQNIKLIEAENGKEAIEKAKEYRPDLILMDIKMPGMDGLEAIECLKKEASTRLIPVIVITASAMKENEKRVCELGASFLRKPVNQSILFHEVAKFLSHRVISDHPGGEDVFDPDLNIEMALVEAPGLLATELTHVGKKMDEMMESMVMSDMAAIAHQLENIGNEHNVSFIRQYASELRHLADTFDINGLRHKMKSFTFILESITEKE